jgi:hypothetical protein
VRRVEWRLFGFGIAKFLSSLDPLTVISRAFRLPNGADENP